MTARSFGLTKVRSLDGVVAEWFANPEQLAESTEQPD